MLENELLLKYVEERYPCDRVSKSPSTFIDEIFRPKILSATSKLVNSMCIPDTQEALIFNEIITDTQKHED